jgi:hypothetical protein
MMTFKEFFNQRDSLPLTNAIKPPTGVKVVKDFMKDDSKPFFNPKAVMPPKPHLPRPPSLHPSSRPIEKRPVEKKPSDFLKRYSNPNKIE